MRASRMLSLLLLLQNRGRMTAPELAAELEVSVRTVYRDVESLSASGVPIYADRGPQGGYQLLDGYRTRLTGLTGDEADTLFLAGVPGAAAELGLGSALAAAQLKLSAALPAELRDRATMATERFHLDAPGWFRDLQPTPFLPAIADAVWSGSRIAVRYQRWDRTIHDRELDPLGLVLKAGVWYLVATRADEPGEGPRTYRVARVLECTTGTEPVSRPPDFSLAGYWRRRSAELKAAMWRGSATVRLSPRGVQLVEWLVGSTEARAVEDSATEPDADGWVTATVPVESIRHAESVWLRLGVEVEVLAPPELRVRIATIARELLDRYGH